jgi:hypothetical protein
MELLSGHEKIIAKSGISLNAGTLNWGFTVCIILDIFSDSSWHGNAGPMQQINLLLPSTYVCQVEMNIYAINGGEFY